MVFKNENNAFPLNCINLCKTSFFSKQNAWKIFEIILFVKKLYVGPNYAIYGQYGKILNSKITIGPRI